MRQFQILLKGIMLRRTKNLTIDGQPIVNLPLKTEEKVYATFHKDEATWYHNIETYSQTLLQGYLSHESRRGYQTILTSLLHLRQACCHPYLHVADLGDVGNNGISAGKMVGVVKNQQEAMKPSTLKKLRRDAGKNESARMEYRRYLKEIWKPSAKVTKCLERIKYIQLTKEKIIIFSQWTLLLNILEIPLTYELGIQYRRYDGTMTSESRSSAASDFASLPDVKVILVSLKAGNYGLNLNYASRVIILDPFWNPSIEAQAINRAHRIGQQRAVHIYRILIQNTVEDRIVQLQERKRDMIHNALDEGSREHIDTFYENNLAFLLGLGGR